MREKKKVRKARKVEEAARVRAELATPRPVVDRGYFAGCDEALRAELRDTRARALVERNKRELAEHRERQSVLASSENALRRVAALVDLGGRVGKADSRVGGWAATVVSSGVDSIAASAAASIAGVPTFSRASTLSTESIGEGLRRQRGIGSQVGTAGRPKGKPGKYSLVVLPAAVAERQCLGDGRVTPALLELARARQGSLLSAAELVKAFALPKEYGYKLEMLECVENEFS